MDDINISTQAVSEEKKPKSMFDPKSMKWYEWLALVPVFFLLIKGGFLGAVIGGLGWSLSLSVMRNENMSGMARGLCVLGITIGYILFYIILGSIFITIVRNALGASYSF